MQSPEIHLGDGYRLRPLMANDATSLAFHANNRKIWLEVRDRLPHPYEVEDAHLFIRKHLGADPITHLALAHERDVIGGFGLVIGTDVERISAEFGYWIGETYWGQGLATRAVVAMVEWAFPVHNLRRIFAVANCRNIASNRVLEKAGFALEGCMRNSAVKEGVLLDRNLWAYCR